MRRGILQRSGGGNGSLRRAVAVALTIVNLGGCASTINESLQALPPEGTPQPAFPAIGATPAPRPDAVLNEEERKKAEEDLKAMAANRHKTTLRKIETSR